MDKMILESLIEYKKAIDEKRLSPNEISSYIVSKPWGNEIWHELNENYVLKRIYINKGHKSSLQSHKKKVETNVIIQGKAEVLLEDENHEMISHIFYPGHGWSVKPKQKHRVIALENLELIEVSTPHLNDVIRYEDDTNRSSGKIVQEHNNV